MKDRAAIASFAELGHYEILGADATELAYENKKLGDDPERIRTVTNRFRRQVREELGDVEKVIIALTEASIVYRAHKSEIPRKAEQSTRQIDFIDPVDSLAKRIAFEYLIAGYRRSKLIGLLRDYGISPIVSEAVYDSVAA